MRIAFTIDNVPCEFHRDPFTGGAQLRCGSETTKLQSGLDPRTSFSVKLLRSWERQVGPHLVRIEKDRPLLFAGFRPSDYRIFVDGQLIAQQNGF
ncbi:MAG TPA: hypothetical protein VF337_09140 [Candidatus Limnocylindrales bacterium]